jgi:polysaccharide chain length determinant protein (PEP-CTERM system associated)
MQPHGDFDAYSASRRPLDIEDYLDILRRQKAWILAPTFGALVIAVVVAFLWPDTYVSTAAIRVVPQQVPETFVPSAVNQELSQRINSMAQVILSRGTLSTVITTFNLYPRERQRRPLEDVVEEMKRDIRISPVVNTSDRQRGVSAFTISFAYENRHIARAVARDLATRFINENVRTRTAQSVLTTSFLSDQLEAARKELERWDERLTKLRQSFAGQLPEEMQQNWTQLMALEQRVANLNAGISRANQEKLLLETDLRNLKNQLASLRPRDFVAPGVAPRNEKLTQAERDVQQLENALLALRERYRDSHPDVQRTLQLLNAAQRRRDELLKAEEAARAAAAKADKPPETAIYDEQYVKESAALKSAIERTEALIRQHDIQIEEFGRELDRTQKAIAEIHARMSRAPIGQQQFAEVLREREMAKLKYDDLSRKQAQSQISAELERRQASETLEILEDASLPEKPTEPNRAVIIGAGVACGLVLGLLLAGARELKNTTLKNLKDVRAYTRLDILGSIPLLENDLAVQRRRRLTWLAWATACLVGVVIMTGSVLYYYGTRA